VLGKPALEIARDKLVALKHDFDTWESTTLGADFPKSGAS